MGSPIVNSYNHIPPDQISLRVCLHMWRLENRLYSGECGDDDSPHVLDIQSC